MSDFEKHFDKSTIDASKRFIDRIKDKTFKKQVQLNNSPEYPIEKASNSFDNFVKSDQFKTLLTDDGKQ
ncbi:MAG: hypothetical protein ABUK01_00465 [Leptospirales bacterium]